MRYVFLIIATFFLASSLALAHGGDSFTSINGLPNESNPAASGSIFFKIPNELAVKTYLVNEQVNFKIDPKLLPDGNNQVVADDFIWEFGNNQTSKGLAVSTRFSQPGSYLVYIKVRNATSAEPVELESMQVNILPTKDYSPPKAVIEVNGKLVNQPFEEPIVVKKGSKIKLSAKSSEGNISKYTWDLADGTKLKTGPEIEHTFTSSTTSYAFFPVLRVEDKNGLYSDTIVQIIGEDQAAEKKSSPTQVTAKKFNFVPLATVGLIFLLVIGLVLFMRRRVKGN